MKNLLALLLLFSPAIAKAATINAATANYADVLSAFNTASSGDTVQIPAGTVTWSSTLDISAKPITLMGNGSNSTIITRSGAIAIDLMGPGVAGGFWRISNLQLKVGGYYGGGNYPVHAGTTWANTNTPQWFRIDHCWFDQGQYTITVEGINGWGVIDHCTFRDCGNAIQMNGGSYVWPPHGYAITPGTTNCLVIEDNQFITRTSSGMTDENIMSGHGVRFTVRNNYFDGRTFTGFIPYENHGKGGACSSPPLDSDLRGPPIFEIYNNRFECSSFARGLHIRGGSFLVWSNTFTGTGTAIQLAEDSTTGDTTYAGIDQVENSYCWNNTQGGVALVQGDVDFFDSHASTFIQWDRDVFFHAPDSSSGKITWTDFTGGHSAVFNSSTAQAYYPYTPLVYPHPLVTAQDGGGGAAPTATVAKIYGSASLGRGTY